MGLAWPAKPLRREREARKTGDSSAQRPPIDGRAKTGHDVAPVARQARGEAARLEIDGSQDWTLIVRRCMDGDSGAWAELVRTHHRRVYGLCYRFTGNGADAEDLTQDVFLKVYSNLASFDVGRGSLQVWITTMTRNLLVDNFRRTRNLRATGSLDQGWDNTEELKPVDRLTANGPSPHESAAKKNWQRWCRMPWRASPWSCARR